MPKLPHLLLPLLLAACALPGSAAAQRPPVVEGRAGQLAIQHLLFDNPVPKTGPAATGLPFRRDPAVQRQAETLTVKQLAGSNQPAADQLQLLFASQNVLAAWGQAIGHYGLRLDNVADAFTANWLVLYLVANELPDQPPAAQVAALRQQLRRVVALPAIAGKLKTSAQRQQLADYLSLQSLLLNEAQTGAEKSHDTAASATLAQQARQIAQQNMGFDPTTVKLTDKGLEKK